MQRQCLTTSVDQRVPAVVEQADVRRSVVAAHSERLIERRRRLRRPAAGHAKAQRKSFSRQALRVLR